MFCVNAGNIHAEFAKLVALQWVDGTTKITLTDGRILTTARKGFKIPFRAIKK